MRFTLTSAINNPVETANEISSIFSKNYPKLSENLYDKTNILYKKYSDISNKIHDTYPGISSGLTQTKSTITETFTNGSTLIYSLHSSIGETVYSYTAMFEPVDDDVSEVREITRTSPNENLGENVIPLKQDREEIVLHILNLYNCEISEECFKHYDEAVIFTDPIVCTNGLPNLKANFYGMYKLFVKPVSVNYQILENTPNKLIINVIRKYKLPFVGRVVVQHNEITLELTAENKITKHTDRWYGKSTGEGGMLRKGVGKIFSTVVNVPN